MTTGISAAEANEILDAWANTGTLFAKLHVGDPGATGASNPATLTTRQAVSFGAAAGGQIANDAEVVWSLSYPANETISHISYWDHISAGNFITSDPFDAFRDIQIGDEAKASIGDLVIGITPIAA